MDEHPLSRILDARGRVVLDGGLSTALEARGHDLNHPLWSARLLDEDPEVIREVHRSFLEAGADVVVSSSYQASTRGLVENGSTPDEARTLLERSFRLAEEACAEAAARREGPPPVPVASIGPYGAYLADGSEYRAEYGLTVDELVEFHQERYELLAALAPLLAIETVPCRVEAAAFRELLARHPRTPAWVSFCAGDGRHIVDGTPIRELAASFADVPNVIAVGVNCTHPAHVPALIDEVRASGWDREVVAYSNSGETYDAERKSWLAAEPGRSFAGDVAEWLARGARIVGGCCRITESDIATLHHSP